MQPSVVKPFTAEESVGGPRELEYILTRLIGKAYTATLVKVNEVQEGKTGPVGLLHATDLIQQMDGNNDGIPNVPMRNLPYFRLQGGANAVIIDPKPGDIGLAVFAQRDISQLKQSREEGPPPSLRTHDVSDGLYIGGLLNGEPSQWIHFLDSGIDIVATGKITYTTPADYEINAASMTINTEDSVTINAPSSFSVNAADAKVTAETTIDGTVSMTATLDVVGALTAASVMTSGGIAANGGSLTMQNIVDSYQIHTHPDNGPPVPQIPE